LGGGRRRNSRRGEKNEWEKEGTDFSYGFREKFACLKNLNCRGQGVRGKLPPRGRIQSSKCVLPVSWKGGAHVRPIPPTGKAVSKRTLSFSEDKNLPDFAVLSQGGTDSGEPAGKLN